MIGAYIRVSSKMQEENDSIQNQRKKAQEFGLAQNQKVKIFMDVESGSHADREQWTEFKNAIVDKKISIAWVNELDRSNRNLTEASAFWDLCSKIKIPLWIAGKQIDYNNDGEYWMYSIGSIQSAVFLRQLSRKVADAKTIAYADGRKTFRQLYGYSSKVIGANKKNKPVREWFAVPEEVEVIRKIYSWYLNDKISIIKICQKLNELGYRTKNGRYWADRQIYNMLHHIEYTGFTTDKDGNEIASKVYKEKIISIEQYKEVQKRWKKQTTDESKSKGRPASHMASGLLRCARCNSGYFWHDIGNGWSNYYHAAEVAKCGQTKRTPTSGAINWICRNVYHEAMLQKPETIYKKLQKVFKKNQSETMDDIDALTKSIAKTDNVIKKLLDLYEQDDSADISERLRKRRNEKEELEKKLADISKDIKEEEEKIESIMSNFSVENIKTFERSDERGQREMLAAILKSFTIDGDVIKIELIDKRKYTFSYTDCQRSARRENFVLKKSKETMVLNYKKILKKYPDYAEDALIYMYMVEDDIPRMIYYLNAQGGYEEKIAVLVKIQTLFVRWLHSPDSLSVAEMKVIKEFTTRIGEAERQIIFTEMKKNMEIWAKNHEK